MELYHGSNHEIAMLDPERSRDTLRAVWLAEDDYYAAQYGDVLNAYAIADGVRVLDIADATDGDDERAVAEWVEIISEAGLAIEMSDADYWGDTMIRVWSLWDDCDVDATGATNIADAIRAAGYDAIRVTENGHVAWGILSIAILSRN